MSIVVAVSLKNVMTPIKTIKIGGEFHDYVIPFIIALVWINSVCRLPIDIDFQGGYSSILNGKCPPVIISEDVVSLAA